MSKPNREDHLDRTGMEQMSTAGLEKLLLEGFHSPERGEAGMDGLYAAAQVLAEREPYPCDGADRAWERFRENYLPFAAMIAEDGGMPSSDAARRRRHTPLRRWPALAALAAVLCALLLSASVATANG